jgi:hypothetical protein
LSDAEMDVLVVRALSRMPRYAPSRGFADRVMSRVRMPQPRSLVLSRRALAWAAQPRRALALAGAYVVAAVLGLAVAVPWLLASVPSLRVVYDQAAGRIAAWAGDLLLSVASWWVSSGFAEATTALPTSGFSLWLTIGAVTFAYTGAAVGLHFLLRTPKAAHAPARVSA